MRTVQEPTRPAQFSGSATVASPRTAKTLGRLAAVLFLGSGLVLIVTIPLPGPSDFDPITTLIVGVCALLVGAFTWEAPWDLWPRWASLCLVPVALALIAAGNVAGGSEPYVFGVFYVVVFMWIGIAHPRWTSTWMALPAVIAYVVPILIMRGDAAAISTVAITIPICVLVGESLAWGMHRLTSTEEALARERDVVDRLRTLDHQKRLLLSTTSHELRTPITICRGYLDVLDATDEPSEMRETMTVLEEELGRMSRIVEDITTVVRLEDPEALHKRRVEMEDLLDGLQLKARPFLNGRLSVQRVSGDAELDPERITQALLNLLENAAKYGAGTPVELRTERTARTWRFEVTDRGPGLTVTDADRLFQPFERAADGPGMGMGLAVVGAIARAHHGSTGVRREDGSTVFSLEVPR
jgi:signal transduction histidine kinase